MPEYLNAGVGRTDITPAVPIDLVGYSRRWQAATEVRAGLTATALVIDDGDTRVTLMALDLPIVRPGDAAVMRNAVAAAVDSKPDNVLINVSHTHAGPHTHTGGVKIGGDQRGHSDNELRYIEELPALVVQSAEAAVEKMEPVRAGGGVGSCDLAVNRRERTPDGRTILGWNPKGICDREVGVLRMDRPDGSPFAIVVNYACHPVVVGPEDLAVNPDFPGPMRDLVEKVSGAICLFLQGAGGNVLPLQGFFDHTGPEIAFGERLGIEALHVAAGVETTPTSVEKLDYGSVTPISLYRRRPTDPLPEQRL
ncbi:MAG: neutral/alkaline non-lysosomal ceramidase N-terminal domain-containing protein, partial [Acidobacteria bacterium]|nr:neutral/alkaline non-lysosomal ceramidase N-terminal domain-containing protein [Acidobacteriota bacterium]